MEKTTGEPGAGQRLLDGVEAVAVEAVRPAVDVEHQRVAFLGSKGRVGRHQQPGLDDVAAALGVEAVPARRRRDLLVEVADLAAAPLRQVEEDDSRTGVEAGVGLDDVTPAASTLRAPASAGH